MSCIIVKHFHTLIVSKAPLKLLKSYIKCVIAIHKTNFYTVTGLINQKP